MAVPGHDQWDWEFAKKFGMPIIEVISGGNIEEEAYEGDGELVNSEFLNGLNVDKAKDKIIKWLEDKDLGEKKVRYKLRDWVFSRQRYWGEPFPLRIHKESGEVELLDEDELPLMLPKIDKYELSGTGESPLANIDNWVEFTDPETGEKYGYDTNTMPQWAGSCWYYLRYLDPRNDEKPWDQEKEKYWMPVDLYIGGAEHAVLHLLYARFWHKVLFDLGYVSTPEPFQKLINQGMILGEDGEKMSKSRGNVINPDDVIEEYGADTFRLYEMFMGPLDRDKPWNTDSIKGISRFLNRVWDMLIDQDGNLKENVKDVEPDEDLKTATHKAIKKVTEDMNELRFNTAISELMVLSKELGKQSEIPISVVKKFINLLNPMAPHITEEIADKLGMKELAYYEWPEWKEEIVKEETIEMAVQINGKVRGQFEIEKDADKEKCLEKALAVENVQRHLEGVELVKKIVVPNKLVSLVVK